MKGSEHQADQLLLFEKQLRWCDVPRETRERIVRTLAQLFVERLSSRSHSSTKEQSDER